MRIELEMCIPGLKLHLGKPCCTCRARDAEKGEVGEGGALNFSTLMPLLPFSVVKWLSGDIM